LIDILFKNIIVFRKEAIPMNEIGQRMRQLREANQLSQVEVAKLSGSNQATIAKTETGKTAPSVRFLIWWADYFDVSLDYLCCRTDKPQGKLYECIPKASEHKGDMKQFIEMCFDPQSPYNEKLKGTLLHMMEEAQE